MSGFGLQRSRFLMVMLVLASVSVSAASAAAPVDGGNVMTMKTRWALSDIPANGQPLLIGGLAAEAEGAPSLLAVEIALDAASWVPVSHVTLRSRVGELQRIDGDGGDGDRRIGPFSLAPERVYETVISTDMRLGTVSLSLRDDTRDTTLFTGAWGGLVPAGADAESILDTVYPIVDDAVTAATFPWYEPVEARWETVVRQGNAWLATDVIEPQSDASIRLVTETRGSGRFKITVDEGESARQLAAFKALPGETFIRLPVDSFPLGTSRLTLQYVVDGQIQFASSREIAVGHLDGGLRSVRLDPQEAQLRADVQLTSDSFLPGLALNLTASMDAMVWDTVARRWTFRPEADIQDGRARLSGTTYVLPGTTSVPVTFPLHHEPGLWRVRFQLSVTPDISVDFASGEYIFSSATPDVLAAMQGDEQFVAKQKHTLRICTYNIMNFLGYPEAEAAKALGDIDDPRRIEHFRNVFQLLDCDIVGIQEGGSARHMEQLADALDQHVAVYPSSTIYLGGLITRFPIVESRSFNNYRVSGGPFSRFAAASLLDIDGEHVWVVNLHAYPHQEETRVEEARVLGERVDELLATDHPIIVLGDFNSRYGGVLHEALLERNFVNAHSVSSKNGLPSIDHIYVSSGLKDRIDIGWIVREPGFDLLGLEGPGIWVNSDHVPTVLDVNWP